jgi:hypothetical protein
MRQRRRTEEQQQERDLENTGSKILRQVGGERLKITDASLLRV